MTAKGYQCCELARKKERPFAALRMTGTYNGNTRLFHAECADSGRNLRYTDAR